MSKENSEKNLNPKKIWFDFYFEPYFKEKNKKEKNKKKMAVDLLGQGYDTIKKQLSKNQVQKDYIPTLLILLLEKPKFYNQYLNIGLQHRRMLENSQKFITTQMEFLEIVSYEEDRFYKRFIELAKIEEQLSNKDLSNDKEKLKEKLKEISQRLENIKELKLEEWEITKETLENDHNNKNTLAALEKSKQSLEIKYKLSWHIAKIRWLKLSLCESEDGKFYESITEQVKESLGIIRKLDIWDSDIAMFYLAFCGYKFIGPISTQKTFVKLDGEIQNECQKSFEENLLPIFMDKESKNDLLLKIKEYTNNQYLLVYYKYYYFLYLQRKLELKVIGGGHYLT